MCLERGIAGFPRFYSVLINFDRGMDPYQARQNVGMILNQTVKQPNGISEFYEKVDFEKKSVDDKNTCKMNQKANNKCCYTLVHCV